MANFKIINLFINLYNELTKKKYSCKIMKLKSIFDN